MTKRMLTAVLTAALALSLTACGGGEQQEMGETRTVYTMDTVMNLTAYGENASAALDAAEETLRALDAAQLVDEIIIATREDRLLEVADLCRRCGLRKPVRVVQGGENRTQSVLAAACEADAKAQFIAVHDGARPLVLPEDVDAVIRFACQTHAAAPALPVTDTVKTADETGRVTGTPDRSTLFAVQTPQVFQADVLKAALQSAAEAKLPLTDDCAAVERLGKQVYLLPGNPENIKITRPLDLAVAAAILRQREERNA